ncbi:hypothetical protein PV327_010795 [Microctonus hyperodae]|uniref:Folylpolyglutamate synthase n=1 Tax=Microctonus hyperodae TaxID=165561 RepID=A0AA39C8E3_MICHY|nr:hypothetical protein PV327_010795 [Microctonus hyperodae]
MNCLKFIINKSSRKLLRNVIKMRYSNINSTLTYQDAIEALNNLQSNAAYLRNAPKHDAIVNKSLEETKKYISRSGMNIEQLDKLSVIHVAGTKGKGSTCAYVETILRQHGYKTGLYTSPHLVSVRERIMINGRPINEEKFANHFRIIYEKLISQRSYENDMPTYFKFLTIMMFHIFINASIDVAVIEVGIGGEHDCTNIIRNPVCVGISKLDLDHISLLGNNIKSIAFQKSGIFKNNTLAFTVPQLSEAMSVLYDRANEKKCLLSVVPPISNYSFDKNPPKLGIAANIQYYNASLAIQLSKAWLSAQKNNNKFNNTNNEKVSTIDINKVELALANCKWPGRTQLLRGNYINFYLDGAHTIESIEGCIEWFINQTNNSKRKRILMFNVMGNRDARIFLNVLKPLNFHSAFFVPNVSGIGDNLDQDNKLHPATEQINGCEINCNYWDDNGIYAPSVNQALKLINEKYQLYNGINDDCKIELLITGSLHLVGAALSVLDPNLTMSTNF